VALGADGHNELIRNDRHGAGHAMVALYADRVAITPNLPPIRQREAAQRILLLIAVIVHEIDPAVQNHGTGVTFAHVNCP